MEPTCGTCAIGGTQVWVIQTYRQQERGDVIFLEVMGQAGAIRLAIPAPVAATIARQRDALTSQIRSRVATRVAADRKARGIVPGFLRAPADVETSKRTKKDGAR
jgi:hypothetical protein